jgi:hypothetical protein
MFVVEVVGHAGEFDFAVQRFVSDAEQSVIGRAKAKTVGGDGQQSNPLPRRYTSLIVHTARRCAIVGSARS